MTLSEQLTESDWEEIWCLGVLFEDQTPERGEDIDRQSIALACLGKAQEIDEGRYGDSGDGVNVHEWADQLRQIAGIMLGR